MKKIASLKEALAEHKIRLSSEQLADLDKRQWLEDMRAAMNATQSEEIRAALKGVEAGIREFMAETIQKCFQPHLQILARVAEEIEGLGKKVDGIEMPEASTTVVEAAEFPVDELVSRISAIIPKASKVESKASWAFEVQRDADGRIARIFADGE